MSPPRPSPPLHDSLYGCSDDDLVRLFTEKEEWPLEANTAFQELYRRHAPGLLAYLLSRLAAADAEDLHQDVWQQVVESAPRCYHGGSFRAWVFQIARNRLIDFHRKQRPEYTDQLQPTADADPSPLEWALHGERMAALRLCLGRLEERMAVLVRERLCGRSYQDICRELKLTRRQAHKMFHTAKARLKDCVREKLGD